jgi:hypothetical protein
VSPKTHSNTHVAARCMIHVVSRPLQLAAELTEQIEKVEATVRSVTDATSSDTQKKPFKSRRRRREEMVKVPADLEAVAGEASSR